MQHGVADCGYLAIAFVTALSHGHQPGQYFFRQSVMQAYLRKVEPGNVSDPKNRGSRTFPYTVYAGCQLCLENVFCM